MKRNQFGNPFLAPLLLWSNLSMKAAELMLASAQVIRCRAVRAAAAGLAPSARDWHEFVLMGHEKVEAAAQCGQAMAAHVMTARRSAGAHALEDAQRATTALMSLAASRTPAQAIARQAALARALAQSATSMAAASKDSATLAERALRPIHARATANAKRLAKR